MKWIRHDEESRVHETYLLEGHPASVWRTLQRRRDKWHAVYDGVSLGSHFKSKQQAQVAVLEKGGDLPPGENNAMTDNKHTPGPWEAVNPMCKSMVVAFAGTPEQITIAKLGTEARLATTANAALIASAPTLKAERDALRDMLADMMYMFDPDQGDSSEAENRLAEELRYEYPETEKKARALLAGMETK